MITYLGSLTIGAAIPGGASAAAAGQAGIGLALPDIQARLAALAQFQPQPISLTASLAIAQSIVASIQASIALGVQPPSLGLQIALVAALVADLEAAVLNVNAQLTIVLDFLSLIATAGVHGYAFNGQADELGPDLSAELAGGFPGGAPSDASNAIVLATTSGATWAAMSQVFKVTP